MMPESLQELHDISQDMHVSTNTYYLTYERRAGEPWRCIQTGDPRSREKAEQLVSCLRGLYERSPHEHLRGTEFAIIEQNVERHSQVGAIHVIS